MLIFSKLKAQVECYFKWQGWCGTTHSSSLSTGDKESLQQIAREELPKLRSQIETFHKLFSQQWLKENKVFGLDTVDIRMGGLLQRIKRAESRIEAYLAGQIAASKN